ncbi:hypothetical protein IC762_17775 [Bradyrhizobium genosp. L]|uniref:hypothetical protein n=1 Tax=Bradyrhizobium genosp. L TaxID=83637 RepID=UPI0018A282BA|nr:hypothetical protein [Bradyrhizobium genosp. L]QPF81674.1 hypothetical protein IC762_17775 [Bradyrhizobium genosp. L]
MNLHSIVAPIIGAINPLIFVTVRKSVGPVTNPDFTKTPGYATPGGLTASIAGNVLDVTAVASGLLQPGQTLADTSGNLQSNTLITAQLTGTPGGIGTYQVSVAQDVASEAMTTALVVQAQVQALSGRDLRQLEGLNLQGTLKSIYLNGDLAGAVRVSVKGGDLVTLPDGSVWLVTVVPEPWNLTAGWTHAVLTLQDGS